MAKNLGTIDASSAIRWEEIVVVWYRVRTSRHRQYRGAHPYILQRGDGSRFQLGSISTNQELKHRIEQETARLLFPEALVTYQQGHQLSFGPFTLDQSGLTRKRKSLPWNEVAMFQFANGSLLIKKQGRFFAWADVSYEAIPNLHIFQRLSAMILGRSSEESDIS
ncbi:DUF6585 family protein [Ktedonobacter sp. SOSP1-85]|uniref:DUF6585 family protein n=1 Tax=Ktedonobacter sp. SOSP1-85 TaxID=2778367 RepID=UPI0027DC7E43|nr:DUF6585 family protein [Ktedonobacter sp. SOSP1-85]